MASAAPAPERRELVLGRYRPLRPLGSGGSGSVWLARDEENGREVALKVVAREGKAAARAEREAAAAARLRHPSCLRAYAFAHDSQNVYIAYEYAPGKTFRDTLRAGELDDAKAIEAAAQILEGLAHAHEAGILHRDVKPSNVLLVDGEDDVSVRLLDFGLARIQEAETLTAVGDVPGTLAYISPERLRGEAASPASDVWSVGVMLWEALAGCHPFWSGSLLETARAIEAGPPPLDKARPDLPKPLLAAVARALAPAPARRPTAAQLARTLRASSRAQRLPLPRSTVALDSSEARERLLAGGLAGVAAGWGASLLPFYPSGWPVGIAAAAAVAAAVSPRAGLALALAAPVFPLGNLSLGLAVLYGGLAAAWLALAWRHPRTGLLAAAGPVLGPLGALGLVPLLAAAVRCPFRRAVQAAAAVLLAALAAGLDQRALPLTGERPPLGLGISGSERPLAVGDALLGALVAHGRLAGAAAALAAAAALLPYARTRGLWWLASLLGAALAATVAAAPAAAIPLVAATWVTFCVLALKREH